MRIAYITATRIPDDWAHVLQILQMCEALAKNGITVELIAPNRKVTVETDPYVYAGVERVFTIKKLWCLDFSSGSSNRLFFYIRTFSFFVATKLYLLTHHFDAIYTREHLAGLFFKDLFYEVHSRPTGGRGLYKLLWKHIRGFIVITESMRSLYLKQGVSDKQVHVAADAVKVEEFDSKFSKEEARVEIGLSKDAYVYGYVGTLKTMQMEKGVACAIQALKFLPEDVSFAVVGGEPADIEEYRALAEREGVSDQVLFFGKVAHSAIPTYLRAFDAVVAPFPDFEHYRWYMSPLKIFEYMASGTPMVVSDLPSLREVLSEDTAVLIPPADSRALATAIQELRMHPDTAKRMADSARTEATEHFSWDARAQGIIGFIQSLS